MQRRAAPTRGRPGGKLAQVQHPSDAPDLPPVDEEGYAIPTPLGGTRERGVPVPDDLLEMPDSWRRVWAQLADPDNLSAQVVTMAEAAGVDRSTWYRITANPDFEAAKRRAMMNACGQRMGRVIDTLITSACILGRDGAADRRVVLEMSGMYEPGAAAARERAKGDKDAAGVAAMSDDALLALAEEAGIKIPPAVARRLAAAAA